MQGAELVCYTEGHRITGTVGTGAQRLSDVLNSPQTGMLELRQATYQEMRTGAISDAVSAERLSVRKEELLLVVPLDGPGMGGRVQTEQIRVRLACPFFQIEGSLHRRPSDPTNISVFIGETTRTFIPVSGAAISYLPNAGFDAKLPVVLVRAARIQFWVVDQPPPTSFLAF